MSSIANVFDAQAAGYERNVRENWESLEQWERDYYAEFASWANDKRTVNARVLTPERRGYHHAAAGLSGRELPLTIGLAYLLIMLGAFVMTMPLEGAALGLAAVNVARGRWGHGLTQFALAAGAIALYRIGAIAPGETYDTILSLANRYR